MNFDDTLNTRIRNRIKRDYAFRKTQGSWLQQGKCPECGKNELFVNAEKPRVLKCGRLNSCRYEGHVRDLYPEFFEDWSSLVPADDPNPTAVADAYLLHDRGFDLQFLRGAYSQETYQDRRRRLTSATVRFALANGAFWERLIDRPHRFDRKANFSPIANGPSYQGHAWLLPGRTIADYAAAAEIWFTEGVFDAVALEQGDFRTARDPDHPVHKAVEADGPVGSEQAKQTPPAPVEDLLSASLLTCNNYPEQFLRDLRIAVAEGPTPSRSPRLIFALDNGKAGTEAIRDFVERARDEGWRADAALPRLEDEPGRSVDWNDLFRLDRLGHAARAEFRWHGDVAIADDEREKAFLLWQRRRWSGFAFTYGGRTWWASFPSQAQIKAEIKEGFPDDPDLSVADFHVKEAAVARRLMSVELIANCTFRALYFERNETTDTSAYWLRIDRPGKHPRIKASFPGSAVAASGEFKKRLVSVVSGAIWTGDQFHLDRIMQRQLPVRDVTGIEFTGYCRDHGVYVLGDIAVAGGKVYRPNQDGYFDIGKGAAQVAIKLRTSERILDRVEADSDKLNLDWLPELWTAWGPRGIVVLTFFVAALHAEQIRAFNKSLGFLEITGPAGAGKSTLTEFLWRTLGREGYEGFDPAKSTQAGIARELAKVGNLPVVFIEGDRTDDTPHSKRFDWEETKTLYNGRATRTRGVKNDGLETYSPPFRGAFAIVQNDPVSASRAVLERIMAVTIDKSGWSEATRTAALKIENWPIADAAGFIVHALRHEPQVMERFTAQFAVREAELLALKGVSNARLAKTHGQLLAMLDALPILFPDLRPEWKAATETFIRTMAVDRHFAIASDHPHIETFWDRFHYIEERIGDGVHVINHSRDPNLIAIRLTEFEARCADNRLPLPCPVSELRKLLKGSRRYPFVAAKPVNSRRDDVGTVQCWVFQRAPANP